MFLYIIVDALDECEEKSREKFLRSVSQILELYNQKMDSPRKRIKFLTTGQPYTIRFWSAIVDQSRHYHLSMESRSQAMIEDVINFINNKVDELVAIGICTTIFANELRRKLHQLAGNSFLWASVVLEQSRISLELGPESLPQLLSVIPIDLKEAYTRYLPKVPTSRCGTTSKIYSVTRCMQKAIEFRRDGHLCGCGELSQHRRHSQNAKT